MRQLGLAGAVCLLVVFASAGAPGLAAALAPDHGDLHEEPRPFDESADAAAAVDAARAAAAISGRRVLLVLGGNWCHDSRALARHFSDSRVAALLAERFELVYVDVGMRDRNLDIARRFGVDEIVNTPTILILSADGAALNRGDERAWRNAAGRTVDEALDYFGRF